MLSLLGVPCLSLLTPCSSSLLWAVGKSCSLLWFCWTHDISRLRPSHGPSLQFGKGFPTSVVSSMLTFPVSPRAPLTKHPAELETLAMASSGIQSKGWDSTGGGGGEGAEEGGARRGEEDKQLPSASSLLPRRPSRAPLKCHTIPSHLLSSRMIKPPCPAATEAGDRKAVCTYHELPTALGPAVARAGLLAKKSVTVVERKGSALWRGLKRQEGGRRGQQGLSVFELGPLATYHLCDLRP